MIFCEQKVGMALNEQCLKDTTLVATGLLKVFYCTHGHVMLVCTCGKHLTRKLKDNSLHCEKCGKVV